ncbi:MAG: UxaA family hydrolase, partial [Peribacillus sp.]
MNVIKIHPHDNVLIALNDIKKDEFSETYSVRAAENVNFGHKIALQKIKKDEPVIKYGCCIGTASQDINPGEWVHTHNVKTTLDREQAVSYDFSGAELTLRKPDLFEGFRREDGRAGVRNEIWIIPTVGCVNSIAQRL